MQGTQREAVAVAAAETAVHGCHNKVHAMGAVTVDGCSGTVAVDGCSERSLSTGTSSTLSACFIKFALLVDKD